MAVVSARFVLRIKSGESFDDLKVRGAHSVDYGEAVTTAKFIRKSARDACLAYPIASLYFLNGKEINISLTHDRLVAVVDTLGVGEDELVQGDAPLLSITELGWD